MILDEIAKKTYQRVALEKQKKDILAMRKDAEELGTSTDFPFYKALAKKEMSFICEVKKASPSKGIIAPVFPYVEIAKEYEGAGADAISVLTEPYYFLGSDLYLSEIKKAVTIPLLRKDFMIDPYQIYEAKTIGASAILLICALLDEVLIKEYRAIALSLGLSVLVETHTEQEVEMALNAGADIIGVNNRNLKTFEVDITTTNRLRRLVPEEILFVSESGIKTKAEVALLRENKTDAVLIGEAFMKSGDKKAELLALRG